MKRGCASLAIRLIVKREMGIVKIATRASNGEIVIIMIVTPMIVRLDVRQLAERLLEALRDVVDVVRDSTEQVAARHAGRCSSAGGR